MLDGTHFFECDCGSDEHTLRFTLDKDPEDPGIHTSIFLNDWRPWWKRLYVGIRYALGYKCKYGHWDAWILRRSDAIRLRAMLNDFIGSVEAAELDRMFEKTKKAR